METNAPTSKRTLRGYDPSADVIRPRHLPQATGFSATTAWRMRQRGEFPEPIRLSVGTVGWYRRDIDAWLATRRRTNESAPTRSNGARR